MRQYIPYLLIPVVASALISPCQAQTTVDNKDSNTNKTLTTPQPNSNIDTNKSTTPTDTISQATTQNKATANLNPRIPIPSRIFPSMQQ